MHSPQLFAVTVANMIFYVNNHVRDLTCFTRYFFDPYAVASKEVGQGNRGPGKIQALGSKSYFFLSWPGPLLAVLDRTTCGRVRATAIMMAIRVTGAPPRTRLC